MAVHCKSLSALVDRTKTRAYKVGGREIAVSREGTHIYTVFLIWSGQAPFQERLDKQRLFGNSELKCLSTASLKEMRLEVRMNFPLNSRMEPCKHVSDLQRRTNVARQANN